MRTKVHWNFEEQINKGNSLFQIFFFFCLYFCLPQGQTSLNHCKGSTFPILMLILFILHPHERSLGTLPHAKYRSQNLVVDTGGFKPGALQFRTRTKCLTYCANYQMIILPSNTPHLIIQFLFYKQLLFHISLSCSGQNYGSTRKVANKFLSFN